MDLSFNAASNVAMPLLKPSASSTQVAFDSHNRMNIQTYINDTVTPPNGENVTAHYRWYICSTYYSSYLYDTLNWVMGEYPPQNPSCCKVSIIR
ncbi:hypothetical protein LTR08_002123 [Meristemomyces frigidus]|nr:hypothetical protein LTR08_002123 [Meristemomyces frigidus]